MTLTRARWYRANRAIGESQDATYHYWRKFDYSWLYLPPHEFEFYL